MNNQQFNFLRRIGRYLWRLVIIDNSFKAGSYLLVVSVILLLVARIFGISFLSGSYLLIISPLIGLVFGMIVGLFSRPSLADVTLVVDSKLRLNHSLPTAYECASRQSRNPIEDTLVSDMAGQGNQVVQNFTFGYNWRYFYLFVLLSGIFLVIWFTPLETRLNDTVGSLTGFTPVLDSDIITISQGISEIKQRQGSPAELTEIISQVEELINDIKSNRADKTVILETINRFIQESSALGVPTTESAKLQSLLAQLKTLVGSSMPGNKDAGTSQDNGFSVYQPQSTAPSHAPTGTVEGQVDKSSAQKVEINMANVIKSKEEAINNPYLPDEYKEIVKKYFEQEVDSKQ